MEQVLDPNDICVTGIGCVLPGAAEPEAYWKVLLEGETQIRDLPPWRWMDVDFYSKEPIPDHSVSRKAGFISDEIVAGLPPTPEGKTPVCRQDRLVYEAARQALAGYTSDELKNRRVDQVFGAMNRLEELTYVGYFGGAELVFDRLPETGLPNVAELRERMENALFKKLEPVGHLLVDANNSIGYHGYIRGVYGFKGEDILLDAACASSLAAIDLAVKKLKGGETDLVLCGGVEADLSAPMFCTFTRVGVLSPTECLPFDKDSMGLSQGEACVLFALERAETAVKSGRKIHAVIRSTSSSSDGRAGSLFSPTVEGQLQMYRDAYRGLDPARVAYLEAHATGTTVGDQTEFESLTRFFSPHAIPVGSVKALLGHTRGAAGAVSVLKAILMTKAKKVPPSKYFKESVYTKNTTLFVNKETLDIPAREDTTLIGCSALGFGGTNYHVVVEEARDPKLAGTALTLRPRLERMALIATDVGSPATTKQEDAWVRQKFFAQSMGQIDKFQIHAAVAAKRALENLGAIGLFDRKKISVLSATTLPLPLRAMLGIRTGFPLFFTEGEWTEEEKTKILALKDHFCPVPNEDLGAGILNNVVAGRICNLFDLTGKNYNIDQNAGGFPATLDCARRELESGAEAVVVVALDEKKLEFHPQLEGDSVQCFVLTTEELCRRKSLKPLKWIMAPQYELTTHPDAEWNTKPTELVNAKDAIIPVIGSGTWRYRTEPVLEEDWSNRAFLFTGQGPDVEGAFAESVQKFATLKTAFETADKLAAERGLTAPSEVILNPQNISLPDKPRVRNLALLALECGLADLLMARGLQPKAVTGHSFGEFAAWVVAGSVKFEDMFEIVHQRDNVCAPPANSLGYLIATQADEARLKEGLDSGLFHLSNRNTLQQTVISVKAERLEEAEGFLREKRIAHKVLRTVPQPYHSPLMDETSKALEKFLRTKNFEFKAPKVPVFSSVAGRWIDASNFKDFDLVEILSSQVLKPVDFVKQIKALHEAGIRSFLELGPGSTLATFALRILENEPHQILRIGDFIVGEEKFRKKFVAEVKNSKFFGAISEVIGRITGYDVQKIVVEDRFQDDLGIDSLKKAEIVFEVVDQYQIHLNGEIDLARLEAVGDVVQFLEEQALNEGPMSNMPIRATRFGLYESRWEETPLWRFDPGVQQESAFFKASEFGADPKKALARLREFMAQPSWAETRIDILVDIPVEKTADLTALVVAVRDLMEEFQDRPVKLMLAVPESLKGTAQPIAAFFKALQKEYRLLWHKTILFDTVPAEKVLRETLHRESTDSFAGDILYRGGKRLARRPAAAGEPAAPAMAPKNILFFGATGGIGSQLLKNWPEAHSVKVTLVGRRPESDGKVAALIAEIKPHFGGARYIQCDLSGDEALSTLDAALGNDKPDLVVNSSGVEKSASFVTRSAADIADEFANKLGAARRLEKWGIARNLRVIHFTSIVARYGNTGQALYSFSNAVIENEAREWIAWPPWKSTGMAENLVLMKSLMSRGVPLLDPARGCELFQAALKHPEVRFECQSEFDHFIYSQALNDQGPSMTVTGQAVAARGFHFERNFEPGSDLFLQDHQFQGQMIVPAAAILGMLISQGRSILGRQPILRDFKINAVAPVPVQGRKILVFMGDGGDDSREVFVYAQAPQAKCFVEPAPLEAPVSWVPAKSKTKTKWSGDRIYKPGRLFHGPLLQDIKTAELMDQKRARTVLKMSELPKLSRSPWYDRFIHILDSVFQLFVISTMYETQKAGLPVEVGRIWMSPDITALDEITVWTCLDAVDEIDCAGRAQVVDKNGVVHFDLRGVKTRHLVK